MPDTPKPIAPPVTKEENTVLDAALKWWNRDSGESSFQGWGTLMALRDALTDLVTVRNNPELAAPPVVETSQADEAAWIGYDDSNASGYGEHAAFLAGRASAKAEQAPGQPSPIVRMRPCVSCSAGGDHEAKQCALREDTGVPNEPVWLCDECYDDWRQQP